MSLDFTKTRNKSVSDKTEHYSQNIKHDRITGNVSCDKSRQVEKQMCSVVSLVNHGLSMNMVK